MRKLLEIITTLEKEWTTPKSTVDSKGEESFFKFKCTFFEGVGNEFESFNIAIPQDLKDFYKISNGARLFEDTEYGQWGMNLFSLDELHRATEDYKHNREDEAMTGDLIIGDFLGDSDLLLIRIDEKMLDYGKVAIVNPIYKRPDWYWLDIDFLDFIEKYASSNGGKFWEHT